MFNEIYAKDYVPFVANSTFLTTFDKYSNFALID